MRTLARKSLAWVLAVLLAVGVWGMAGVSLSTVSAATNGDYTYTTLSDGTLSITGYTGSGLPTTSPGNSWPLCCTATPTTSGRTPPLEPPWTASGMGRLSPPSQ